WRRLCTQDSLKKKAPLGQGCLSASCGAVDPVLRDGLARPVRGDLADRAEVVQRVVEDGLIDRGVAVLRLDEELVELAGGLPDVLLGCAAGLVVGKADCPWHRAGAAVGEFAAVVSGVFADVLCGHLALAVPEWLPLPVGLGVEGQRACP